jgi:hypothetical protein
MDGQRPIRLIRIDVPLRTTSALFFVDPPEGGKDPWWATLWEYLSGLATHPLGWEYEPVQEKYFARPVLNDDLRRDIVRFLRTAPPEEIQGHRTLRRAVELKPEQETRVDVMYFSYAESDIPLA